jgi:hypothetical protein|tara:strand:- start:18 stop:317 length:300 start_codon:yes stop_codon:yes gene_type:complete
MATMNILLTNLAQSDGTTERHLGLLINDFARSRTVEELRAHVKHIVAKLDGSNGMTTTGFMTILRLGLSQSVDAAKNMFNRNKFDETEWERLGPALQGL